MAVQQWLQIEPGFRVRTWDGQELGRVKELQGAHFKVDAPRRRDYWLPSSIVSRTGPGYLTLAVPAAGLDGYRMARPALDEVDIATVHAQGMFSEEELRQQSERMEREVVGGKDGVR